MAYSRGSVFNLFLSNIDKTSGERDRTIYLNASLTNYSSVNKKLRCDEVLLD